MNKVNKSLVLKACLLIVALVALCIPYIKYLAKPVKKSTLYGAFDIHKNPELSIDNWLEGTYQKAFDQFYNQNFCLNSFYIKLNNQFFYSIFQESATKTIVAGKDNYLFEKKYIDSYLGNDFKGEAALDSIIKNLKSVQTFLETNNAEFVLLLAPNKARVFPQYFPYKYRHVKPGRTNYDYFINALKNNNINHIDFNTWIESLKVSDELRFTKYSTHWSVYSGVLASDSLFKYIAYKKGISNKVIIFDSITYTNQYRESDNDLAWGLNLNWDLPALKYCYPTFHIKEDSAFKNIKWLGIGDSFYWYTYNIIIDKKVFNNHSFWYYSKLLYPESTIKETPVTTELISAAMKKNDVVVMVISEPNLHEIPYGINTIIK